MGCSLKGRIWSYKRSNMLELIEWCDKVGGKVLDENVKINDILEGTLLVERIAQRPNKIPISIQWPEEFYKEVETRFRFDINNLEFYLFETDIKMIDPSEDGDLKFALCSEKWEIPLTLELSKRGFRFYNLSKQRVWIKYGRTEKRLEEYFNENPPTIMFVDGSSLEGNLYIKL